MSTKIGFNVSLDRAEIDLLLREGVRAKLERQGHKVPTALEFQTKAVVYYEHKPITPPAPTPTAEGDTIPPKPGLVNIKPSLQSCMITWED